MRRQSYLVMLQIYYDAFGMPVPLHPTLCVFQLLAKIRTLSLCPCKLPVLGSSTVHLLLTLLSDGVLQHFSMQFCLKSFQVNQAVILHVIIIVKFVEIDDWLGLREYHRRAGPGSW